MGHQTPEEIAAEIRAIVARETPARLAQRERERRNAPLIRAVAKRRKQEGRASAETPDAGRLDKGAEREAREARKRRERDDRARRLQEASRAARQAEAELLRRAQRVL
jgi:hypothetical protein